ncbi:hypothetical protein PFISCL1PPCAC_4795, partial [Pristionchus fissidentatus]
MSKAIGIDLGTTYTCVAYMKADNTIEVVKNKREETITPSVVTFENQLTFVGEDAVDRRGKDPKNTIFQVKRFMGRLAADPEIQSRSYPFEIVGSKKGDARIRVTPIGSDGVSKVLCPEQISSAILRYAKAIAERAMGHEVTEAVITVPANFTNTQRQATVDAGEIAGLTVKRIINEPTAAALAYGFGRTVLVYDLGGGTFDVSIVTIDGTDAVVKATQGLTFLGGEDFDRRIFEEAVAQLRKKVTRETFEDLCQDQFEQTIECVKDAIAQSGCATSSIDHVILVGGSSRIPRIRKMLQDIFGNSKLKFDVPADHAVARGAAILAASLTMKNGASEVGRVGGGAVRLADVTPFSLGTDITHDRARVIIPRNTPYPTSVKCGFTNGDDHMDNILFQILEGEKALASENNLLGEVTLECQPRLINENRIMATYSIDENGILHVHVKDEETGKEVQTTVKTSMLTIAERNQMVKDAKKRAATEAVELEKFNVRTLF